MAAILTVSRTAEEVLQNRYEKSATALLAVAQILERDRPLAGGEAEFLSLLDTVKAADPDNFTQVWLDPFAYRWSRLAYQLLACLFDEKRRQPFLDAYCAAIGETDIKRALFHHLDDFKLIAIGVALAEGKDLVLDQPLVRPGPIAVPGSRLVTSTGLVEIAGVAVGRIVDSSGRELATQECPVAEAAGLQWRLQPAAFHLPGLGFQVPEEVLDLDYQRSLVTRIEEALEIVASLRPELQECFATISRTIAVKPFEAADYTDLTHSELPGSFICSPSAEPHDLADTLIHEFHHNLLYAIEEDAPFFEPGTEAVLAYYSPWRPDVRDLHGVLHAQYVFTAAAWMWLAAFERNDQPRLPVEYMHDRLVRYPLQMAIGEAVLEDNARFTDHGRALFAGLKAARLEIEAALARVEAPRDADGLLPDVSGGVVPELDEDGRRISTRESVRRHVEMSDTTGTGRAALASHSIEV